VVAAALSGILQSLVQSNICILACAIYISWSNQMASFSHLHVCLLT
jgi:hypothetical protein